MRGGKPGVGRKATFFFPLAKLLRVLLRTTKACLKNPPAEAASGTQLKGATFSRNGKGTTQNHSRLSPEEI